MSAPVCVHATGAAVEALRQLLNAHDKRPPEYADEPLIDAAVRVIQELNAHIDELNCETRFAD